MSRQRRKNCESIGPKVLAQRIEAIRDECHQTVEILSRHDNLSDAKLAECLRLTDSLEAANRFLKSALAYAAIIRRKNGTARTY